MGQRSIGAKKQWGEEVTMQRSDGAKREGNRGKRDGHKEATGQETMGRRSNGAKSDRAKRDWGKK